MTIFERYARLSVEYIAAARRRNLSEKSVRNYENRLKSFGAFLLERYAAGTNREYADYDDVTAYIDHLTEAGTAPSTLKQYLVELNQFFTYATKPYVPDALRYEKCPVSKDFYPKTPARPVGEIMPDYAVEKLWSPRCMYAQGSQNFPRNYAIVVLILSTGLRNKEVLDLTLADIDFENGEITVRHGKGDKFRIVDAPEIALSAILWYLHGDYRPAPLPDTAPLFGTTAAKIKGAGRTTGAETWHRGSTEWLSNLIERHVFNQTGFHDCRSHDLRHLFARTSLNATGNLAELQGALGHTDPKVTERYSGRLQARRRRESAKKVLTARDAAAAELREKLASLESSAEQRKAV